MVNFSHPKEESTFFYAFTGRTLNATPKSNQIKSKRGEPPRIESNQIELHPISRDSNGHLCGSNVGNTLLRVPRGTCQPPEEQTANVKTAVVRIICPSSSEYQRLESTVSLTRKTYIRWI